MSQAEALIRGSVQLPTLPQVIARINALVDDPDVGVREIGAAVSEDAPIASKVLRLANSAQYGLREKVLSTEHATAVLGVSVLRTIAMQASVVARYDHLRGQEDFNLEQHWRHSILVGKVCGALASRSRARIELAPDEFQVVGLLHDMGKLLLLESNTDTYLTCVREARSEGLPAFVAEERSYGFHHGEVGALIAEEWGLPPLVAEAARYHHGPREHLDGSPTLALVALGNLIAHEVAAGDLDAAHGVFGSHERALLCLRAADVSSVIEYANELLPQIQI